MNQYSQNDEQWKSFKHGTSNSTLGATGCTITGLSMLLWSIGYEENPATVNKKLSDANGYANGNLLIWSAIEKIWPRAKFQWRGWSYTDDDNSKVKDAISKYGACLIAVDGSPIGGAKKDGHWVIYIGNKKLIDPFDGLEKPTSTYSATGYAVIELIKDSTKELDSKTDSMSIEKAVFEKLVTKASWYDSFKNMGFENAEKVSEKIRSLEKTITSLNELVSQKNMLISLNQEASNGLIEQINNLTTRNVSLVAQAKKVPDLQKSIEHLSNQKITWTESEKTFNRQVAQLKVEIERLSSKALSTLLKASLKYLIAYIKHKFAKVERKKIITNKKTLKKQ